MKKTNQRNDMTDVVKERCPNGYHRGEDGLCHHKVTGQVYDNSLKEQQSQQREVREKSPEATDEEVKQKVDEKNQKRVKQYETYKVRQDSQEAKWATNSYGSDEKSKETRRKIIESEEQGKIFKFKAKPFSMVYKGGQYVLSDSGNGFAMDGITPTNVVYKDENGEYLPERKKLHHQIVQTLIENMPKAKEGEKPRVLFTGGGSGTGKSSMKPKLREAGWEPDTQTLDSDYIMTNFLPEYEELVKQDSRSSAFLAHDEASDILSLAIEQCIKEGREFIIDGTLKSKGRAIALASRLKDEGYDVSLRGIFMNPKQSWSNCTNRYINAKSTKDVRYVPKEVAQASNIGFTLNCMDDDFLSIFDDVEIYDRNDQSQNRVVMSRKDGKTNIEDQELYNNATKYAVKMIRQLINSWKDNMRIIKDEKKIPVKDSDTVEIEEMDGEKYVEIEPKEEHDKEVEAGYEKESDDLNTEENVTHPDQSKADDVEKSCSEEVKKHHIELYQFPRSAFDNEDAIREIFDMKMGTEFWNKMHSNEPMPTHYHEKTYEYDGDDSYEGVFQRFNLNHPEDFKHYSLSVGDIVVIDGEAKLVDFYGFTPIQFQKSVKKSYKPSWEVAMQNRINSTPKVTKSVKSKGNVQRKAEPVVRSKPTPKAQKSQPKQEIKPVLTGRQAFMECCKSQSAQGRMGLTYDEIQDIMGAKPDFLLHSMITKGKVRRIKASDGYIYNFRN